jgi:lipopolysaccharide cholinephosphotransferase
MSNLLKTKPAVIKKIYQLGYDVQAIFETCGIKYWMMSGTLLGAIRHRGIIPWDDDIDLGMLKPDIVKLKHYEPVLKSAGLSMVKIYFGYKIFYSNSKLVEGYDYAFPAVDIFVFKKEKNHYILNYKAARDIWPEERFLLPYIDTLKKYPFGMYKMYGPSDYKEYFGRYFGGTWNKIAYRQYDHATETEITKVKVKLTDRDRVPAEPFDQVDTMRVYKKLCVIDNVNSEKLFVQKRVKNDYTGGYNFDLNVGTFVINCDSNLKRLEKFTKFANGANLKFDRHSCTLGSQITQPVVCDMIKRKILSRSADMTPVQVAISISHYNVWQRMINNKQDYALVLEDDAEPSKNFVTVVNNILNTLSAMNYKFSILFLWNGNWMKTRRNLSKVVEIGPRTIYKENINYNAGAVAYIISREFAQYLLDKKAFPIKQPQDILIGANFNIGNHLTVEMAFDKTDACYISKLVGNPCGGPWSTGSGSMQEYDTVTVKKYNCEKCK